MHIRPGAVDGAHLSADFEAVAATRGLTREEISMSSLADSCTHFAAGTFGCGSLNYRLVRLSLRGRHF
jgi:hypothetical protein